MLTHSETLWDFTIIGNFDGEVGPYNEVFDDILANNPADGGKWMIWEDGDLVWAPVNSFEGYNEAPFFNMAPTSEDLLVGQFTSINGRAEEVMMQLDVL